jgi:hypothetical protein
MSRGSVHVTWALAAIAALGALAVMALAEPLARALHSSGASVFPGGETPTYYAAQLRRTALAWVPLLPAFVLASALVVRGLLGRDAADALRPAPVAAVAAAVLIAAALVPRTPTGDEPAYLAMAGSLARSGSLDVAGAEASLHRSPAARPGENRSVHNTGLPVMLAIPARLGGEIACRLAATLFALALLAALAAGVSAGTDPGTGRLVAAALAPSFPIAAYGGLVLPEIAGALALWLTYRDTVERRRASAVSWLAIASLPWLHVRLLPGAVLLAVWALARPGQRRTAWPLAGSLAASLLVMAALHQRWYGSPSPFAMWRGSGELLSLANAPVGVLGLLVDQQYGLLVWAPLFLLAPVGLLELARTRREHAAACVALIAVTAGPGILHSWWGGWSPAARFLVAAVGPLALLLGAGVAHLRRSGPGRRVVFALAGLQLAIGALVVLVPGKLYGTFEEAPRNYWLDLLGRSSGVEVGRLLPSLRQDPHGVSLAYAAILVAAWLLACWWLWRRQRPHREG